MAHPPPFLYIFFPVFSSVVLRAKSSKCGSMLGIRVLIWFGTKVEIPVGSVGHMGILSSGS